MAQRDHASIVDVAARARVSPATVSRALRGLPHVSQETRLRVVAAARDLNYVASPAGTNLASGRTLTVGIAVPLASRWFFAQAVAAAEEVLEASGYDVLVYNLHDQARRDTFFDELPSRRRVDGLVVVSLSLDSGEAERLRSLRIPIVLLGSDHDSFTSVLVDDVRAAREATEYLVSLGHDSPAMISVLEDSDFAFSSAPRRRTGFNKALGERGLEHHFVAGEWGIEGGARAMRSLLRLPDPPTAVFAEYDELAFGALMALRETGVAVPRDMSVVGFDDHELARAFDLTTIAQPVREQGTLAATSLLSLLAGGDDIQASIVLPTRLVIRGTTGPPRRGRLEHSAHAARSAGNRAGSPERTE